MNKKKLLSEALRNQRLAGIRQSPSSIINNVPLRGDVVSVEYKISGFHRPSTQFDPEEHPEVELLSVKDIGGNEIDLAGDEENQIVSYIEQNQDSGPDEPDFDDRDYEYQGDDYPQH